MHIGAYSAKVELFADYCSTDKLDTVTKDYAFNPISGKIIDVDWPNQKIGTSATLVPWVTVENTGAPTNFYIKFSIQGPNDKWYQGACSSTGVIEHNEKQTVWPSAVQVTSSMPKGACKRLAFY